ncbi:dipeptidase, putative [Pilibacter termitis]|uniref:Dipeptidase, putative n=1 Tax=Pilibacter termitis TaxID=263852 RepID=A0A1T4R829_9ENTE|nr:M20 family metallopeptidase [Pilibacter termitis]SKA12103.1 dipeptidase, putative [Pilibacter termitis]
MKTFITETHQRQAVEDLKKLLAVPSVLDEQDSGVGHPFGKNVVAALDKVLELCETLGFKTFKDPEGYYGYAEVGAGEKLFGILCHMDVVPAGDVSKWSTSPFEPVVKDGFIVARGSQDDKGPSIAALYAVKALMDADVTFDCRIRFIFGSDEETLWRCIDKYNEKEEAVTCGFAPDAHFPLTYAEKGLLQAYLTGKGTSELQLHAGGALNVVPDVAEFSGEKLEKVKEKLNEHGFAFSDEGEKITVLGKSIHAKDAPEGINALTRLAIALSDVYDFKPLDFLGKLVKENATGENVVGKTMDEASGELTMNFASLEITPEQTKIGVDMRIPVTIDKDELAKKFADKAKEYDLTYEEYDWLNSLYVPLESELVQTLLSTYRDFTGDMSEPLISGGATFARTMNQCVAFGAMFPDTPDLMHQPNEAWELESMYKVMEIYAEAIYRLCGK